VRKPRRILPGPFEAINAAVAGVAADVAGQAMLAHEGNRWQHLAQVLGRLVAQGLEEPDAALAAMRVAAAERLPGMDAAGRDMRMAWLLREAVARWEQTRDRARFAIRRALGPLLAERAASGALVRAAQAVNEAAGTPLLAGEVLGEVRREVYWAARRAEAAKRRRA